MPAALVALLVGVCAGCASTDPGVGLVRFPTGDGSSAPPHAIDAVPVTTAEYAAFVHETGMPVPTVPAELYAAWGLFDLAEEARPQAWNGDLPAAERADHPVTLVPAAHAERYCAWAGQRRGLRGRLPTEDEWILAAGGADGRAYPWGEAYDPRRLNDATAGPGTTTPVGAYPDGASPFGVLDMAGNVFEWTATAGGRPDDRIVKGGSYASPPDESRIDAAVDVPAGMVHPRVGFRCVYDER